jgi:Tfp pilus assembly protein PilF
VIRLEQVPLGLRAANAVLSYCLYARDAVWPARLAAFYPRDVSPSLVVVGLAAAMLIGVSIAVVRIGKNRPYLPVGWFWHLGTLVPMIGLVQVGNQSRADRYMYIPLIGVAIIMAWGIPDLSERWPSVKKRLPTLACFVIVAMAVVANVQAGYWKDDAALWTHALDVTSGNYVAHNALGLIRSEHGKPDEAIAHLTEALRIRPEWLEAKNNLANVLARQQRVPEAIALYTEVIQIERNNPELHYNLASALRSLGKVDEAIAHYSEALRIRPRYANAHFRLGATLLTKDRLDEAKSHFNQALSIDSRLYGAHYGLALAFEKEGKIDEAIRECKEALRVEPGYPEAQSKLAELTRLQSGR